MPTSYEKYAEFDPPDNAGAIGIELDDGTLRMKGTDIKTSWMHAPVQKKRGFWGIYGRSLFLVFVTLLAAVCVFFLTISVKSCTGHGVESRYLLEDASSPGMTVPASLHDSLVPVSIDPVVTAVTPELAKRQTYGGEHSIVTISLPVFSTVNTGYPPTVVEESTTSSSAHTTTAGSTQLTGTTTAATISGESVSFGTISTPEGSVMSHTSLATIVDTSVSTYLSTSVATYVNMSTIPAVASSSALTHSTSDTSDVTVTRTVVPIMSTSIESLASSTHTVASATTSAPLGNGTIVHPTPSLPLSLSSSELVTTIIQNSTVLSTVHASETGAVNSGTASSSAGTAYGGPPVQTSYATPSLTSSTVIESTASTRAVGSTRSTTVTTTVSTSCNCTTASSTRTRTFIYTTETRTTFKTSTVVVTQTPTRTSTIVSNDAVTASQLPTITVSTSVSYSHTPSPSAVTTSTAPVQPTSDSDDEGFSSTVTVTFTPTSLPPVVVTKTTVAIIESSCSPTVSHVTTTETAQGRPTTVFVSEISTYTAMASCSPSSTAITETETITETVVHTVYPSELTSATTATVQGASSTGAIGGGGGEYSYSESVGFTVEGSTHSASTSVTPHILTSASTSTTVHGSPSIISTVSKPAIPMVSISPNTTATVTWIPFETRVETGTTSSCANSTQTVLYTPPASPSFDSSIAESAIWSTFVATASSGVGVESIGKPTATSTCTSSTETAPRSSSTTVAATQSVPSNGTTTSSSHRTTTVTNTEAFPSVIDASEVATEVTMTGVFGNVTFTITGATGGIASATTDGHHGGSGAPNATATVIPVVSDGGDSVKPARLYWGDTNGGSSNACVVMLVALVCAVMVLF
ncbi:hypothetical protein DL771_000822 [Monosporascus sp. 5C6A]|nr:hypothetical protein DL771_000822 [Monosporascus sp. 5C6A]